MKNVKKTLKINRERDEFEVPHKGVDQRLYADQLWRVDKYEKNIVYFVYFQTFFFLDLKREITEKGLKLTKKVENGGKKCFNQLLCARSTCVRAAPKSW